MDDDDDDDDPFGLDERFRRNQRRRVSEGDDDAFGLGEHLHTSGCVFFANAFLTAMLGCWASNLGVMTDSIFQHVNLAYMRKPPEISHRVMS